MILDNAEDSILCEYNLKSLFAERAKDVLECLTLAVDLAHDLLDHGEHMVNPNGTIISHH